MNEFSVRKLSEVVYSNEGVVSKYRMPRPHSGTDRPFNLFAVRTSHKPSVQPSGMEAAAPNCRTRRPSIIKGLHLCDAAIHEQFYSRDSSDARDPRPWRSHRICRTCRTEQYWKSVSFVVRRLLRKAVVTQPWCVDGAWAHRAHANAAFF
jgi:hypothetical protein